MKNRYIIGYYNIPNFVTGVAVLLALMACHFAFNQQIALAMLCLMYAGVIDAVDGAIARWLNTDEEARAFGAEIDCAADIFNYGLPPIVIGISAGFTEIWDWGIYWVYAFMLIQRVSYFNIYGVEKIDGILHYIGIPTTYSTVILPLFYGFYYLFSLPDLVIRLGYVLVLVLFVLNVKVRDIRTVWWIVPVLHPVASTLLWIYILYVDVIPGNL